jgi:hypothetical protein
MNALRASCLALSALVLGASLAFAQTPARPASGGAPLGSASSAPAPSTSAAAPSPSGSAASAPASDACVEHVPDGKARPKLMEQVPARGVSGHALVVELVLSHGKGETVLPMGVTVLSDSPEVKALEREKFVLPDLNGIAGPKLKRVEHGETAETTVLLSVVPLPPKPGRQELRLPSLPISLSRASGEVITLCTQSHSVIIEDPIANSPNPQPRRNPPGRRQLEIWQLAKQVVSIGSVALALGAVAALLFDWWRKRPKKLPPPPPPRPPWEIAMEELYDIRHAGLTREGRFSEHFDRVSDTIRRYLGDRYGFDGPESTTREAIGYLREVTPYIGEIGMIETFLRDADLVKFARLTPSEAECMDLLARAESIVTHTVPAPVLPEPLSNEPGPPPAPDEPAPQAPPADGGTP